MYLHNQEPYLLFGILLWTAPAQSHYFSLDTMIFRCLNQGPDLNLGQKA